MYPSRGGRVPPREALHSPKPARAARQPPPPQHSHNTATTTQTHHNTMSKFQPQQNDDSSRLSRIQTMVPGDVAEKLSAYAQAHGLSVSALTLQMFRYCLADMGPQQDEPEEGKTYRLTGKSDVASVARGDSWEDSAVEEEA